MRRRLALVVATAALVSSVGVLPTAHAADPVPPVAVTARQFGCAWLNVLNLGFCLGA